MRKIRKIREIEKKRIEKKCTKENLKEKIEENFKVLCVSVFMYFCPFFYVLYLDGKHTANLHICCIYITCFCSFADMWI